MILNATEAVYQWLLFLRGKNGAIVANFGKIVRTWVFLKTKTTTLKSPRLKKKLHAFRIYKENKQ